MLRRVLTCLFLAGSGAAAVSEPLQIDTEGFRALAPFVQNWQTQAVSLDAEMLAQIEASFSAELPEAYDRFQAVVTTTGTEAQINVMFADESPIRVAWLTINEEPKVVRVFINTVHQNSDLFLDQYAPEMVSWLEQNGKTPLLTNLSESVANAWNAYTAPSGDHPWVSLGAMDGRIMAWGVPPDFFEVVIADEGCAFFPSRAWFMRQIC